MVKTNFSCQIDPEFFVKFCWFMKSNCILFYRRNNKKVKLGIGACKRIYKFHSLFGASYKLKNHIYLWWLWLKATCETKVFVSSLSPLLPSFVGGGGRFRIITSCQHENVVFTHKYFLEPKVYLETLGKWLLESQGKTSLIL